jgi:3-hydroxyisobutyrate dehydrogenase-like beta-hydroxyacid dehydrogenase
MSDTLDATPTSAGRGPVAVIGLGIMGGAIAANLVRAGHPVRGFDLDAARVAAARDAGVAITTSATQCAAGCRVILASLPSDRALDSTVDALLAQRASLAGDAVLVELSTLSPEAKSRSEARLAAAGVAMLDCPISGTGAQAVTGDLVLYSSGDEAAVRRCEPVLRAFSRAVHYVGAFGNGMRLKLVANLLVAVHNVATAEAIALAKRAGLDPAQACELLGGGAGASRILQLRGPMMAAGVFEPATMKLDVWQKDLDLIAGFAQALDARTPLFDATLPLYAAALQAGLGRQDTAAVFRAIDGSL